MCIVIIIGIFCFFYSANEKAAIINLSDFEVGKDFVYIHQTSTWEQGEEIYKIDLVSKEIKISENPYKINLKDFEGLPKEMETATISTVHHRFNYSKDKTKAFGYVSTYDNQREATEMDEPRFLVKREEYLCDLVNKSCSKTNILKEMQEKIGNIRTIFINSLDTERNVVFAYHSGHGIGTLGPVIMYNYKDKTFVTSSKDNETSFDESLYIPNGAFSPSANKFVIRGGYPKFDQIMLYSTQDITMPEKVIEIKNEEVGGMVLAWSPDEKMIAFGGDKTIHTLDLITGNVIERFKDNPKEIGSGIDFNTLEFSQTGKFIVFVDKVVPKNTKYDDYGRLQTEVLKIIDVDDNRVGEVLNNKNIDLITYLIGR